MRNRTMLILALASLVLVGAGCASQTPAANTPAANTPAANQPADNGLINVNANINANVTIPSKVVTVIMNNGGFSPNPVTITRGTTVKFINRGDSSIRPASNPHPVHTDYPGFDPKHGVAPGDSWSFTFNKIGTWGYHDHLHPLVTGTIIVK